jgi:acetolactate synthase I/II/III large subunit
MRGGDLLIETLLAHDATLGFGVPGESYLAALEAMRQSQGRFRYVNTRHESGATFAAEAWAKLTGRPGIAFVTRGPGACNGSIGIHTAQQDSTPLVLFVGQVAMREMDLESFQEVNYQQMFGGLAKTVLEPRSPAAMAEATARALRLAASGRPGPVVVVLPEDLLSGEAGAVDLPKVVGRRPLLPGAGEIEAARGAIAGARRLVVVAAERVGLENCFEELRRFAEASGAGIAGGFRHQDVLDNDHPAFLGQFGVGGPPYLRKAAAEADVVVLAGTRPDDITSDNFRFPAPGQIVIHVYPDADVMQRQRAPDVAIVADLGPTLEALAQGLPPPPAELLAWRAEKRKLYEDYSDRPGHAAKGAVDMAQVTLALRERVPADTIMTNDAGNFSGWLHRYHRFRAPRSHVGPANGAMGYAVPGAIGAQLACPGRTVMAWVGDGGFSMTGLELATAAQEGLPIKVLLVDNGSYGTIWMHQHGTYGQDSRYGVDITRADFAAVARGLGAAAWTVARTEEFAEALEGALAHDGPALIHLLTDPRDVSAARSLDRI